jgi:beta propeller repeat protein
MVKIMEDENCGKGRQLYMTRKPIQSMLAAAMLVTTLWSGTPALANSVGKEVKISSAQPQISTEGLDISKDYAVWIGEGEKTITLYDLEQGTMTKIGDSRSTKTNPKVDGNYVVWIDSRHGGSDLYLYDIGRRKEKRITSESTVASDIEISGDHIVWTDDRDRGTDIYLYDISEDEEEKISDSGSATKPTVGTSYVAWQDERNKDADIYYYDIKEQEEKKAVVSSGKQENPVIHGDQIVYEHLGGDQLYMYSIRTKKTKKLTNDSSNKSDPHLFSDTYIYTSKGNLMLGDVDKSGIKRISSDVYTRLQPRTNSDHILFAKKDDDDQIRLYLYDLEEKEERTVGVEIGEPSDPDGSEDYVIYLATAKRESHVILYEVETGASQVISQSGSNPMRPLVSDHYAVWYDKDSKAIFSYDIRSGKLKTITDRSASPAKEHYGIDGDYLVWVDEDRKHQLILTHLSTGDEVDIVRLSENPLSLDIYGDYVTWVREDGRDEASVYLYEIESDRDTKIHSNVQVEKASLGDGFVVWSEYSNGDDESWDLYEYDIKRKRTNLLMRNNNGDQFDPQASHDMILFKDNRLSSKSRDIYYELYDREEDSYSDTYWDEDAKIVSARMGGNRIVWVDEREKNPIVYTMAVTKTRDDEEEDDDDNPIEGGVDHGNYIDYPIIMLEDILTALLNQYGMDSIAYVAFPQTREEQKIFLSDAVDAPVALLALIREAGLSNMYIRVYK